MRRRGTAACSGATWGGDAQAPRLLAALEYVRDHYPEGAAKMGISMFPGNKFSEETKAKLKQVCEAFVRTDRFWWDLNRGEKSGEEGEQSGEEGKKSGSCCTIL